jgi:hypothetical protein
MTVRGSAARLKFLLTSEIQQGGGIVAAESKRHGEVQGYAR